MNELRSAWIAFLSSENRLTRFLNIQGDSQWHIQNESGNEAELERVLNLLSVASDDRSLLLKTRILFQQDLMTFVHDQLPFLLRSLHHEATQSTVLGHRGLRGRILWSSNVRSQLSGRTQPGSFVVQSPERTADTPENQLLHLLLNQIRSTILLLEGFLGTSNLGRALQTLKSRVETGLAHAALKDLPIASRMSSVMRRRALRHRNKVYRVVAELQQLFEYSVLEDKWALISKLIGIGWLAPIEDDDLFELYLLALILDLLENEHGYSVQAVGLLRHRRAEIARLTRPSDNSTVTVYFDQSPTEAFGIRSNYKQVIDSYSGLTGAERRPDLMLCKNDQQGTRYLIVEAKHATSPVYQRDSIYKVFGYLYDFRELWAKDLSIQPHALLVFSHEVKKINDLPSDLAVCSGDDREAFSRYLLF